MLKYCPSVGNIVGVNMIVRVLFYDDLIMIIFLTCQQPLKKVHRRKTYVNEVPKPSGPALEARGDWQSPFEAMLLACECCLVSDG